LRISLGLSVKARGAAGAAPVIAAWRFLPHVPPEYFSLLMQILLSGKQHVEEGEKSMFRKENAPRLFEEEAVFHVPSDSVISGDIRTKSKVVLDGEVKGDITTSGDVTVGSGAKADGNIAGKDVVISGTVNGSVSASGELTLHPNAKLSGGIKAAGLRMDKGAKYEGTISIGADKPQPVAEKPQPAAPPAEKQKPAETPPPARQKPAPADAPKT